MSLLELDDVRKTFGAIEALRGVTFSVEAGSVGRRSSATTAPANRR